MWATSWSMTRIVIFPLRYSNQDLTKSLEWSITFLVTRRVRWPRTLWNSKSSPRENSSLAVIHLKKSSTLQVSPTWTSMIQNSTSSSKIRVIQITPTSNTSLKLLDCAIQSSRTLKRRKRVKSTRSIMLHRPTSWLSWMEHVTWDLPLSHAMTITIWFARRGTVNSSSINYSTWSNSTQRVSECPSFYGLQKTKSSSSARAPTLSLRSASSRARRPSPKPKSSLTSSPWRACELF